MQPLDSLTGMMSRVPGVSSAIQAAKAVIQGPADNGEERVPRRIDRTIINGTRARPESRSRARGIENPQRSISYSSAARNGLLPPSQSDAGTTVHVIRSSDPPSTRLHERERHWKAKEAEAKVARRQYFDELQGENEEWRRTKAEVERLQGCVADKDSELSQAHQKIGDLERTLRAVQARQQDITALLETRTAELQEAQAFLTKVDGVSDNEVLQLVERLNSTIYQTCAGITTAFEASYRTTQEVEVCERALQVVSATGLLSADTIVAVRCFDHHRDSLIVQMVLQAAMVSYTRWLCNTWDFRWGDPSAHHELYGSIKANEAPSVAGRWRALARKHVKSVLQPEEERQDLVGCVLGEHVENILLACGVPRPGEGALHETILRRFGRALRDIARLALEFQSVAGEDVISRDIFAVSAETGAAFDPDRMIDEWGSPKKPPLAATLAARVVCATQLGLVVEKRSEAGASQADIVLLRPKVVLSTALEELWREHAGVPPGLADTRTAEAPAVEAVDANRPRTGTEARRSARDYHDASDSSMKTVTESKFR